jgi:bifunctional DNA-binding transcriptional regulator/antitoxin component of YhaV-PrlF toxin-antitoxin module
MRLTVTSKRQVTFPAHVLEALGARPGDQIELHPGPGGFLLRARRVDTSRLAPLKGKIAQAAAAFDLRKFREQRHDASLRD